MRWYEPLLAFILYTISNIAIGKALWRICIGVAGILLFVPVGDSSFVLEQLKFPAVLMALLGHEHRHLFIFLQALIYSITRLTGNLTISILALSLMLPLNYKSLANLSFLLGMVILLASIYVITNYLTIAWSAELPFL